MSSPTELFSSKEFKVTRRIVDESGNTLAISEGKGHVTPGRFVGPPTPPPKKGNEDGNRRSVGNN